MSLDTLLYAAYFVDQREQQALADHTNNDYYVNNSRHQTCSELNQNENNARNRRYQSDTKNQQHTRCHPQSVYNKREKKRRDTEAEGFKSLRTVLQLDDKRKTSKRDTLQRTVTHIKDLTEEQRQHEEKLRTLKIEHISLKRRLNKLQPETTMKDIINTKELDHPMSKN